MFWCVLKLILNLKFLHLLLKHYRLWFSKVSMKKWNSTKKLGFKDEISKQQPVFEHVNVNVVFSQHYLKVKLSIETVSWRYFSDSTNFDHVRHCLYFYGQYFIHSYCAFVLFQCQKWVWMELNETVMIGNIIGTHIILIYCNKNIKQCKFSCTHSHTLERRRLFLENSELFQRIDKYLKRKGKMACYCL